MKILLLLLALAAPVRADDFSDANALYEKGEFAAAAEHYEKLAASWPEEPVYHFNLGNAHAKLGHTGRAAASYLRAFRLAPRNADIRHNLAFILGRAGEDLVPPGIPHALFLLLFGLSGGELAGLFWLSVWVFFLAWAAYLLDSRLRPAGSVAAAALALVALFGGWRMLRDTLEPERPAVVVRADAEVRNGPGATFSVGYTLPEGRRLEILAQKGDWLEVSTPKEGIKGWILEDSVEKI